MKFSDKSIIVLAEDGFEDMEAIYPILRLREEGIRITVVGTGNKDSYTGEHGYTLDVDDYPSTVKAEEYDGIIIPGGLSAYKLRSNIYIKDIVSTIGGSNKLIGCTGLGAAVLISAKVIAGYQITCPEEIIDDIINAGGEYTNIGNCVDKNLISAKIPGNLPQFMNNIFEFLSNGNK
jgi:protease I